jgi:hypothetical protein
VYSGLSRSTLDILTRPQPLNGFKPKVRSKELRQTGERNKVRLIDYASLRAYLDSLPDGYSPKQEATP